MQNDINVLRAKCITQYERLVTASENLGANNVSIKDVSDFKNKINSISDVRYLNETLLDMQKEEDDIYKEIAARRAMMSEMPTEEEIAEERRINEENPNMARFI